jgi:hypothetical protein
MRTRCSTRLKEKGGDIIPAPAAGAQPPLSQAQSRSAKDGDNIPVAASCAQPPLSQVLSLQKSRSANKGAASSSVQPPPPVNYSGDPGKWGASSSREQPPPPHLEYTSIAPPPAPTGAASRVPPPTNLEDTTIAPTSPPLFYLQEPEVIARVQAAN